MAQEIMKVHRGPCHPRLIIINYSYDVIACFCPRSNLVGNQGVCRLFEPSRDETNIMASALCIDPDQPAQSALTDQGRHIPSHEDRGIEL